MKRTLRRAVSIATAASAVAAGLGVMAGPAAAVDAAPITGHPGDEVVMPGTLWQNAVGLGVRRGTMIYAFSTKPLDGPVGTADGLPASFTMEPYGCEKVDGATSVYACSVEESAFPGLLISRNTVDMTTVYGGYAYVPAGGDLKAAIKVAQSAGTRPDGPTGGSSKVTVKTLKRAARNTVTFHTPDVPAGKSVRHRIDVHALDAGWRNLVYLPGAGAPEWGSGSLAQLSDLRTSKGMACTLDPAITWRWANATCNYTAGEHWIEFTVTVPKGSGTTPLIVDSTSSIYTRGGDEGYRRDAASFKVGSGPLRRLNELLARDGSGQLFGYSANREGSLSTDKYLIGTGWNTYDQLTKLTPVTEDLFYPSGTPASAMTGNGELVGRDTAGVLWHYQRQFSGNGPYAPRTRVGGGWNIYNQLIGAGDIYRDGKPDLLARDAAGVLWLYKGSGNPDSPFRTRTRVGGGWNAYNQLIGAADITGDGRPDLLARDAAGVLWLYKGNDNPTDPFDARTRVGGGWNIYNQLSIVGDVTGNNRADLVARDAAGVLWLYKGNGKSTALFDARTRVSAGWNTYKRLL
ncbi:VCBS repeat-containing protein [Streptomyces sp. NBC_01298]|uniref:FG-GAP repeat domain-containing protein n=1 Tax=Streptomyces sp. NBC_01298 TaxID=2903817 RepID=UPI002E153118|nr:VCBS repeat-containing protein [Streptomyces sp. NBC_01298]